VATNGTINTIRDAFIAEARSAPSLFADLAKVELYIAESYRTRALIELLQNADDAGSTVVHIIGDGDRLMVFNDGRPFTSIDVEALCRSGASSKQRGSGSIGYRGIGFKSVAGLAREIAVFSGPHAFCYSKECTRAALALQSDVPLIRIPHPLDDAAAVALSALMREHAPDSTTMFLLTGLDLRALTQEVEDLSAEVLIFLNAVRHIEIRLGTYHRTIRREVTQRDNLTTIERITEDDAHTDWLVRRSEGCERVALLLDGDIIVPVAQNNAVIHTFLPTQEYAGALVKLNGDFSTDPSRKAVDLDATSEAALTVCTDLLWQMAQAAVAHSEYEGVFSVLRPAAASGGRVAALLKKSLIARLESAGLPLPDASEPATAEKIRLAPNWLNHGDYEALCRNTYRAIPAGLLARHPNLPDALRWLDAKTLTLQEALQCTTANAPSPLACAQLWAKAAKQMRFDLTPATIEWLAQLPMLPGLTSNLCPGDYDGKALAPEFLDILRDNGDLDDIHFLAKKLGGNLLADKIRTPTPAAQKTNAPINRTASGTISTPTVVQKNTPAIQNWRSAEKNAAAWFAVQSGVLDVRDVSQANVGYDLLVIYTDGRQTHVEVKSVKRMGDPFRLTNNEHATAYQDGENYVLALVVNADPFEICLIDDPIRKLALEKRCEQWSWYAENYEAFINQEQAAT